MTMATERQIAANRRNARNSTGPRSTAGKTRTARNAYRHGLTLSLTSNAACAKRLDRLARRLAGDSNSEIIRQHARAAAHAALDLARIRHIKVALIERVAALGTLDAPPVFGALPAERRSLKAMLAGRAPLILPARIDPLATMPTESRHGPPKPSAGRCRSWSSSVATNPARSRGATGRSGGSSK